MKTPVALNFTDESIYDAVEDTYCPHIAYIEQEGSCHRLAFSTHHCIDCLETNVVRATSTSFVVTEGGQRWASASVGASSCHAADDAAHRDPLTGPWHL
jgi:hypothetical protein